MGERPYDPLGASDPGSPTDPNSAPEAAADTERISAEIEATRADLGGTIDELQERLSPQQLVSNATSAVTDAAKGTARDLAHQANAAAQSAASMTRDAVDRVGRRIARDPLPLTLLAVGVGVAIAMQQRRRRRHDAAPRHRQSYSAVGAPQGTAPFEETRGTGMSTRHLHHVITENPVAIGLAALAAGAAIGLMLPATKIENEYLGETRDSLVDSATDAAAQAAERVQEVVTQTADEIVDSRASDEEHEQARPDQGRT